MDAYVYQSELWCGTCIIERLLFEGKASPAARDMKPSEALYQIAQANGFDDESEYDSDDLPKGPYADGGGEADTPQHCAGCDCHLENPLTSDGHDYVAEKVGDHLRFGDGKRDVVVAWARFYDVPMPDYERAARSIGATGSGQNWNDPDHLGVIYGSAYDICAERGITPDTDMRDDLLS